MPVTQPVSEMIAAARLLINQVSVHEAAELQRLDAAILIDLRDVRELQKMGIVPRAFHAPRGMLEFWIDPDSIYYKDIFACGKKFLFYCNLGWRSALAAQVSQQMGLTPVAHIAGGLDAWTKAGGPLSHKEAKKK